MFNQFIHPFTMIVSGPSGCGKTTFLKNIMEHRNWIIDTSIKKIIWCYSEFNSIPKIDEKNIFFIFKVFLIMLKT